MDVRQITAEETRPVRHAILRPSQPLSQCVYPLDAETRTGHFGAFREGELVGVASIFQQAEEGEDSTAWRIRGMATLEEVRGDGFGGALLEACLRHAAGLGGRKVWCNGRTMVVGFYGRHGFAVRGEEFDLPGLGPHVVMERML